MSSVVKESKLLAKHTLIYGAGTVINSIVAFLLLPIYTRYLTPNDYGVKELIGLTTDVIGILMATAISSAIYRFYFEYDDEKNRNEVISTAIIGLGTAGLLALALLSLLTRPMARYIIDAPELYYYFNISLVSMWFYSINDIGFNYLRARQQSILFVALSVLRLIMVIALNVYFIVFLGIGVLGILWSTLVVAVITTCILIIPIMYKVGVVFDKKKIKNMLRFGLPLIPSQLGAFIVHLSDRFFIKGYCSIADAGLYSLGYRFGTIPSDFVSVPFNQVWQPRRLELYKQPDSEELFGKIFTYYLALITFVGLGIAVLTKDLIMIIADKKFWSAYQIVPIIVLANIVFTLHYHFNIGIIIQKKTKYLAYINLSNGMLVLGLNFLLIPTYGVFGAAYATLIAFIYKVSLTYYLSRKFYKVHFEVVRIVKIVGSAILLFMSCSMLNLGNIYASFMAKSFLIMWYPLVLLIMGFYTKEEKKMVVAFIRQVISTRVSNGRQY